MDGMAAVKYRGKVQAQFPDFPVPHIDVKDFLQDLELLFSVQLLIVQEASIHDDCVFQFVLDMLFDFFNSFHLKFTK